MIPDITVSGHSDSEFTSGKYQYVCFKDSVVKKHFYWFQPVLLKVLYDLLRFFGGEKQSKALFILVLVQLTIQ